MAGGGWRVRVRCKAERAEHPGCCGSVGTVSCRVKSTRVRGERFPSRCSLLRQECGGGRPRRFDDPLIGPDQRPRYFRALCPRRPASPRPTATELPPPESPSRGSAPMVIPRRPPASSNRHVRVNDTEPCSGSAPIPSPGRELPSTSGVRGHMVTGPRSVRRPVSEVEFQRGDAGRGRGNSLAAAASHPPPTAAPSTQPASTSVVQWADK